MSYNFYNLEQSHGAPMLAQRDGRRAQVLALRQQGVKFEALDFSDFFPQRREMAISADGIAFIHIANCLGKGLLGIDKFLGDTDYDDLSAEVQQAADNPAVKAIALLADSPGGMVVGCAESAEIIEQANAIKPVGAWSETLACSACFELAAGAGLRYGSRSSIWGSIGVICTWMDYADLLAAMGYGVHQETAPGCDLKGTYSPLVKPSEEQMKYVHDQLDRANKDFRGHVLKHCPDVQEDSMRGQTFMGPEALERGLIHDVATYPQFVRDLLSLAE